MKKVLIVDDEPNIVMALEFAFRKKRFQVMIGRNGQEALDLLKAHDTDLVVMDIMMPLVNGFETLKAMKNDPHLSQIKVILVSAKNKKEDIQTGLQLGADAYITKPFSVKHLIQKSQDLLAS